MSLPVLVPACLCGLFSLCGVFLSGPSVFGCACLGRRGGDGVAAPVPRSMTMGMACLFCFFWCFFAVSVRPPAAEAVPVCLPGDAQKRIKTGATSQEKIISLPPTGAWGAASGLSRAGDGGCPRVLPGTRGPGPLPQLPPHRPRPRPPPHQTLSDRCPSPEVFRRTGDPG